MLVVSNHSPLLHQHHAGGDLDWHFKLKPQKFPQWLTHSAIEFSWWFSCFSVSLLGASMSYQGLIISHPSHFLPSEEVWLPEQEQCWADSDVGLSVTAKSLWHSSIVTKYKNSIETRELFSISLGLWRMCPFSVKKHWKVKSLSHVRLFATPWTVAYHAPQSMGFSRQEYWSGLPFPSPGDLPDPRIKPRSPAL